MFFCDLDPLKHKLMLPVSFLFHFEMPVFVCLCFCMSFRDLSGIFWPEVWPPVPVENLWRQGGEIKGTMSLTDISFIDCINIFDPCDLFYFGPLSPFLIRNFSFLPLVDLGSPQI